jgi:hypothetical protein
MKKYEAVILGAGHFAVGYAAACENALIVERTYLADPLLSATLSGYTYRVFSPMCDKTEELIAFYKEHGILREEKIDSPLLEIGLSAYAQNKGVRFLFGTECTKIAETEGGYEIELFGNAGFETVFTEKIIDNRRADADTLRILLKCDSDAARSVKLDCADVIITKAFHDGEVVMSCKFRDKMLNVNGAKAKLLRELEYKMPEGAGIVQIAYLAANSDDDAIRCFNDGVMMAKETVQ